MNLRDLDYLVAVADEKHFGRAAARCCVSQPTLSMQLKKLEQELGVELFERDNKRVLVTTTGEAVVNQAREILRHVDVLRDLARHAHDPFSGSFRLALIPTLGPYLLPHILKPLGKALPDLALSVREEKTTNILQALREGSLDAAILALPVHDDALVSQDLFSEPFYVALPSVHELEKKSALSMQDLRDEPLLLLEEGHCLRDQALEACAFGVGHDVSNFQATSLETIRHLVGAGAGITFLPALAVASAAQYLDVTIKPFSSPMPARRVGIIWRKTSVRVACCKKIAEIVQGALAGEPYLKSELKHHVMSKMLA